MSNAGTIGGSAPRFGKYRGKVVNNVDPETKGRLLVSVPEVYGAAGQNWALPCVPYAGPSLGLFLLPMIGQDIWVEFEKGDINQPIWTGCYWGMGSAPGTLETEKVLKTLTSEIRIDDLTGTITISSLSSGEIVISPGSIKISSPLNGSLEIAGPLVKINGDGLEVL